MESEDAMGTYLKQSEVARTKKKRVATGKRNAEAEVVKVVVSGPDDSLMRAPSLQHDINHVNVDQMINV